MQNYTPSSRVFSKSSLEKFQKCLLSWFDQQQRNLPWRKNPSLYKTVVSEFMLQQTRVTTMLPYFENWMKKFPDFKTLANAKEQDILKAWEGLGYYSRARNLYKLAIIAQHWDAHPKSLNDWQKLPGVGPYIAAAVTSISLGQVHAVCDGNVVRVVTRLFSIPETFKDGASAQKKLLPTAQQLISTDRPGDFNQAMMELGATVCHRQSPLCLQCPVLSLCNSGKKGDFSDFPKIKPKQKKTEKLQRYWIEHGDKLLLYASSKSRLLGVYELPKEIPFPHEAEENQKTYVFKRTIGTTQYTEEIVQAVPLGHVPQSLPQGYLWASAPELSSITLSGPHRKWIEKIAPKKR